MCAVKWMFGCIIKLNIVILGRICKWVNNRSFLSGIVSYEETLALASKTELLRARTFGIFRNKNIFRNFLQLFCSWEQNRRNRNPSIPEWEYLPNKRVLAFFQLFLLRIDPKLTRPKFLENALGLISSRGHQEKWTKVSSFKKYSKSYWSMSRFSK